MKRDFYIIYCLLVIVQMFICNYVNFSPYILISILPSIIFLLPTKFNSVITMLISFFTALLIDFFAEGIIGINALAILPVALVRIPLYKLIFGDEIVERGESLSIKKYGVLKVILALSISQAIFLFIYIWADSFSINSVAFNLLRFAISLLINIIISYLIAELLLEK